MIEEEEAEKRELLPAKLEMVMCRRGCDEAGEDRGFELSCMIDDTTQIFLSLILLWQGRGRWRIGDPSYIYTDRKRRRQIFGLASDISWLGILHARVYV